MVAGKYKKSDEEFSTVRKQSSADLLPNKQLIPASTKINRSQTTSDVVNTNTVKMKVNGNGSSNNNIKNENGNYLNGAKNLNVNGALPVYKRNLSGFGRGKFVTNQNLNNNSVGKIDRISFSSVSSEPISSQLKKSDDAKKTNPFFY